MSSIITTIAIDAMGGEDAPYKTLKGVDLFSKRIKNIFFILLGEKKLIEEIIKSNKITIPKYKIIDTSNNISDNDLIHTIIRNKKESSIYKGLELIKNNISSGFVSAGNTGALMSLSRLILGTVEGIDRPAICSIIPNNKNFSIMLDLGANVKATDQNLFQFAIMGFCYHSILKPNIKPTIGIINIGTEDNKGLELLKDAYELINKSFLKEFFIGFVEPNKITSGICDILVCDGYTGNIILKTAEGMSQFITNNLKNVFNKSFLNKIAYKFLQNDLTNFKDQVNPDKYNGASFIGVKGVSIKSHGSASPYAFSHAIEKCYESIKNNINEKLRKELDNI